MNQLIYHAQGGDEKALAQLVDGNVGLIWSIVRRFENRGYELEELFQIGCIGFIKAIKGFDMSYETKLSTYAVPLIMGEIKRFLRDNGPIKVSRSLKELAMKIKEVQLHSESEITVEDMSNILKVDKEDIILAIESTSHIESIDQPIGESDFTIGDKIASREDEYEKVMNEVTICEALKALDAKEKKVIFYRYYREMTQKEVAELLTTSQVQISRIEQRALKKMHDKVAI